MQIECLGRRIIEENEWMDGRMMQEDMGSRNGAKKGNKTSRVPRVL